MLSLLPVHVSSYGASTSHHPGVQSSYDYTTVCNNPPTWGSLPVDPYPSPPMSSSPTATAHFANHAGRVFDPGFDGRMRPQPAQAHELQFWPQTYHQGMFQQPPQQQHQHAVTSLPLLSRSPRSDFIPTPTVSEPYPNYLQSQQARNEHGSFYQPMGVPPGQLPMTLPHHASKAGVTKPARRVKQHVQTACFNCKKAHLSCDIGRPCNRCKQSGKQDTCYNVAHKRRGRPRLRDPFGNKIDRSANQQQQGVTAASNASTASNGTARRKSDPLRVLKSNDGNSMTFMGQHTGPNGLIPNQGFSYPPSGNTPVAFLDLDLKVVRVNHNFNNVFGFEDLRGKTLDQLIDNNDNYRVQRLRTGLRQEKDAREPAYLAPIRIGGADDTGSIPMVENADIGTLVQGFQERTETLRFRVGGGAARTLGITLRLARADVYFAVLILPTNPEPIPSFNQQQPQAPPRLIPNEGPATYSYATGYPVQTNHYNVATSLGPQRNSLSASAPASPFYTLAPQPMNGATPQQLATNRTPYDASYYIPQSAHPNMYTYTTQSGVPSQQAVGSGAEPRHFQMYSQEQFQLQPQPQQQLLSPDYQLPPLGIAGDRPRSAAEQYSRDQHQAYLHDGAQHVDHTQVVAGGQGRGRQPTLQSLLE